jgi:biopolymer transport protein ExbB/TolQ
MEKRFYKVFPYAFYPAFILLLIIFYNSYLSDWDWLNHLVWFIKLPVGIVATWVIMLWGGYICWQIIEIMQATSNFMRKLFKQKTLSELEKEIEADVEQEWIKEVDRQIEKDEMKIKRMKEDFIEMNVEERIYALYKRQIAVEENVAYIGKNVAWMKAYISNMGEGIKGLFWFLFIILGLLVLHMLSK